MGPYSGWMVRPHISSQHTTQQPTGLPKSPFVYSFQERDICDRRGGEEGGEGRREVVRREGEGRKAGVRGRPQVAAKELKDILFH